MIAKSLFAAAALAAAMVLGLPGAEAKTNVDVTIGLGVAGYGYYDGGYDRYDDAGDYGYDYEYGYRHAYRGYGSYDGYDEGISCNMGRKIVYRSGFRDVRALDCDGPGYRYSAWKHGYKYVVRVNENGAITRIRRVY